MGNTEETGCLVHKEAYFKTTQLFLHQYEVVSGNFQENKVTLAVQI